MYSRWRTRCLNDHIIGWTLILLKFGKSICIIENRRSDEKRLRSKFIRCSDRRWTSSCCHGLRYGNYFMRSFETEGRGIHRSWNRFRWSDMCLMERTIERRKLRIFPIEEPFLPDRDCRGLLLIKDNIIQKSFDSVFYRSLIQIMQQLLGWLFQFTEKKTKCPNNQYAEDRWYLYCCL